MIIPQNKRRDGYAVVMMMGLIALLLGVVAANTSSVRGLQRELQLLEKRQAAHWQKFSTITNTPAFHRP